MWVIRDCGRTDRYATWALGFELNRSPPAERLPAGASAVKGSSLRPAEAEGGVGYVDAARGKLVDVNEATGAVHGILYNC